MRKELLTMIRQAYPKGARVELDSMCDPFTKLRTGDRGTVFCVDAIGTIHVAWDSGSRLGVVYGEDYCHVVSED